MAHPWFAAGAAAQALRHHREPAGLGQAEPFAPTDRPPGDHRIFADLDGPSRAGRDDRGMRVSTHAGMLSPTTDSRSPVGAAPAGAAPTVVRSAVVWSAGPMLDQPTGAGAGSGSAAAGAVTSRRMTP